MNSFQFISIPVIFPLVGKGLLAGICYAIPVGPLASISIKRTLESGLKVGLFSFAGMAVADLFYFLIAALGVSFIKDFINEYFQILQIIGFMTIFLIGIFMLLTNYKNNVAVKFKTGSSYNTRAFLSMMLIGLTNPFALIVFINLVPMLHINVDLVPGFALPALSVSIATGMMLWWIGLILLIHYFRKFVSTSKIAFAQKIHGLLLVIVASFSILFSLLNLSF